jgi:hypothetical protein
MSFKKGKHADVSKDRKDFFFLQGQTLFLGCLTLELKALQV